jgi:hypothetical protein
VGGDAEVEQNSVHCDDVAVGEYPIQISVVAVYQFHVARQVGETFPGRCEGFRVMIDADQCRIGSGAFEHRSRVPAAADRAIDVGATGLRVQTGQHLGQQNGFVAELHVITHPGQIPSPSSFSAISS